MKRRKIALRGSANMKQKYKVTEVVNGVLDIVVKQGFQGFKNYRLHPTKGWRKEKGFVPSPMI